MELIFKVRRSYISHLVSAGSALWKMTQVFLAVGPEGCAGSTGLLSRPGCRREVLLAGSRITPFPFSQLLLVMKMGMFPSQFSAGTALSRDDRMGCFFLFPSPDGSHRFGYVLVSAKHCPSLLFLLTQHTAETCGSGL